MTLNLLTHMYVMCLHPNKCLTFQCNVPHPFLNLDVLPLSGDFETSFLGLSGSPDVSWTHRVPNSLPSPVVKGKGKDAERESVVQSQWPSRERYLESNWWNLVCVRLSATELIKASASGIYSAAVTEDSITHLNRTETHFTNSHFWAPHLLLYFYQEQRELAGRHTAVLPGGLPVVCETAMSWDCGLKYMFSVSPVLQQGSMCILHDKEDLSRLEMVQRLAKDGCRFLQNHSKGPERTSEVRYSTAAVTTAFLKHNILWNFHVFICSFRTE